ncbi:hypothetical protein TRVA0_035S01002 [Trichomonascus vanleenenianus]|uniref:uncharacterized protein n=1 Tax=Trichomonascus vanleenenianus TaxID=2268995 RepID=UPI003ECA4E1C
MDYRAFFSPSQTNGLFFNDPLLDRDPGQAAPPTLNDMNMGFVDDFEEDKTADVAMEEQEEPSKETEKPPLPKPGKTRRRRKALSCNFCRQRKLKCDRQLPCSTCVKRHSGEQCSYSQQSSKDDSPREAAMTEQLRKSEESFRVGPLPRSDDKGKNSVDIKRRLDQMESLVMSMLMEKQQGESSTSPTNADTINSHSSSSSSTIGARDKGMAGMFGLNPETIGGADDMDEVSKLNESFGMIKLDRKGKSIYHGDTHWVTLFSDVKEVQSFFANLKAAYQNEAGQARLLEGCHVYNTDYQPSYVMPFNGFTAADISGSDILKLIPDQATCDGLLELYFNRVHVVFPVLNRQVFDRWYSEEFWVDSRNCQVVSVTLLLGLLAIGLATAAPNEVPSQYKGRVKETLKVWASAMDACGQVGRLTVKPSLTHARVLLLWLFVQATMLQAKDWIELAWGPLGLVSRVLQGMGIHRDSRHFSISVFETEERRRMFALYEYLDMLFSVNQGLPMALKGSDYDVLMPSNCNLREVRENLVRPPISEPLTVRTDTSFTICQAQMTRVVNEILTCALSTRNLPKRSLFERLSEFDRRVRAVFNNYPAHFKVRADYSLPEDPDDLVFQRFLLEMDYWKALVILHRPFGTNKDTENRMRASKRRMIEASRNILERFEWLFRSPSASHVVRRFWWYTIMIVSHHFVHAFMYCGVHLMNSATIPPDEQKRLISLLEAGSTLFNGYEFSPAHDPSQQMLFGAILRQVRQVLTLSPEERDALLSANTTERRRGLTFELFGHKDDMVFDDMADSNGCSASPFSSGSNGAASTGPTDYSPQDKSGSFDATASLSYSAAPTTTISGHPDSSSSAANSSASVPTDSSRVNFVDPEMNSDLSKFLLSGDQPQFKDIAGGADDWDSFIKLMNSSGQTPNMP